MAYVIVNDFEGGTREQYDATTAVVHPVGGLPAGQTHHYAGPSTNGWVVIAVWGSKEIWEKFRDETLLPAFQGQGSVLPGHRRRRSSRSRSSSKGALPPEVVGSRAKQVEPTFTLHAPE